MLRLDVVAFRITYSRYADVQSDVMQMANGGVLVRVADVSGLDLDAPATLELVLPDAARLTADVRVLQVLAGHGVAVSVPPELVAQIENRTGRDAGTAPAKYERLTKDAAEPARAAKGELSNAEKIQIALHGNRDQRMAILRDPNRMLHQYVLKNPQTNADDALTIAKNAMMAPELLKMIGERREWFQRPQIALALARNPKTPPELAVRALDYVPADALRQMAKGTGVPPHVTQAARKKVLR
jgi:hypothetical protein